MNNKKPYEAPHMEMLQERVAGKHRIFDIQPSVLFPEKFDTEALLKEYGSPLFIVSESMLREMFRDFRTLFSASGIETAIAYSYKTNYLPAVCSIFHSEGALAEVVSGMEYSLARSIGVPGSNIIFNGPYKKLSEIKQAIKDEAIINIDGFDELDKIISQAEKLNKTANVGIRIHFNKGANSWSRFGFGYESGEYKRALKKIAQSDVLKFKSLHNHSGTFQLEPEVYGRATEILLNVAKEAVKVGLNPEIIDLGGGFPSENNLKPDFDLPHAHNGGIQSLNLFAGAILSKIADNLDLFKKPPKLILEPGRALVDSSMHLITTVVAVKKREKGKQSVVVDAGVNILPTAYWYDHGVEAEVDSSDKYLTELYGPLCMQIDKIRDGVSLPAQEVGECLTISNVGAYCLTQSMQFIQPRPAVVLLGKNGPELIRRSETWQDIFALDQIPSYLRGGEASDRWG